MFDQSVGEDEKFSRHRDDSHFGGLSASTGGLIVGAEARIAATGDKAGHVEGGADARPSAGDLIAARGYSALGGVGCQSGEAGDGPPIGRAEFGQVGDQRGRHVGSQSRQRDEKSDVVSQLRELHQG